MRRTPLRSKRPARVEGVPREVREAVMARAGGRCEIRLDGCEDRSFVVVHHRLRQQHDGPHTLENLVAACGRCHGYVHAHPAWAYRAGLLIHRQDGPPAESWPSSPRGAMLSGTEVADAEDD